MTEDRSKKRMSLDLSKIDERVKTSESNDFIIPYWKKSVIDIRELRAPKVSINDVDVDDYSHYTDSARKNLLYI